MSEMKREQAEALVGVIRPNGQAMFHTQDCAHAKRAMSAHYYLPSDFAHGDLWCSACRPDLTPPPRTTPDTTANGAAS